MIFQLFFEIAINVFNYNEEVSQNILLDFPITYVIPTPGFRSFSTSRGDVIGKLEEIGDRYVGKIVLLFTYLVRWTELKNAAALECSGMTFTL